MENKEEPYNRLVLIGNGFDLAFGLKTKYSDFILDYLKNVAIEAFKNGEHLTDLMSIVLKDKGYMSSYHIFSNRINEASNIKELFEQINTVVDYHYYENTFFEDIVKNYADARWVDIEQHYYNTLKKEFNSYNNRHHNLEKIGSLNRCMDKLNIALNDYIKKQQINDQFVFIESLMFDLMEQIIRPLEPKRSELVKKHCRKKPPENILFLNFNYTYTVRRLINNLDIDNRSKHICIHGTVNDPNNPIIFGYGDDTGGEYHQLELEGENEWLRKIKSFQYPRTNNYHNLLNFLSNGEFDVFVVGHSCGLSDRTLLKTIFEHENCLAIQNFHFKGEEEDFYKRMEISRHFTDKIKMRERLLPFDKNARIPQCSR